MTSIQIVPRTIHLHPQSDNSGLNHMSTELEEVIGDLIEEKMDHKLININN